MSRAVTEIWRHPIKSHGREALSSVSLTEGKALPHDREWAVIHEASKFDTSAPAWVPCSQFVIGAKSPRLQAITSESNGNTITLHHPDLPSLTFIPESEGAAFIEWMRPLADPKRPAPKQLVRAGQAMTDTDYPSVSFINLASHSAVEAELGHEISPLRWRGNFFFEGETAWEENSWQGKRFRVGSAEFEGVEPIQRCRATTANPDTGVIDVDTLKALNSGFGHQDCGLYARVTRSGQIAMGDKIELI